MGNSNSGNRTGRRGAYPPRRVVIGLDLAKQIRATVPDVQLTPLVEGLLMHWLEETKRMQYEQLLNEIEAWLANYAPRGIGLVGLSNGPRIIEMMGEFDLTQAEAALKAIKDRHNPTD